MLRISRLADYGTVVMHCLASEPERLFSAKEVASKAHIKVPMTSKVLKILVGAALITSVRGAGGGYRLARPSHQISVAHIITALDGQPALTECNLRTGQCPQDSVCAIRDNWKVINQFLLTVLENVTLADMKQPLYQHPLITKILVGAPDVC